MDQPLRIVIAKPGLDGHDRGAKVVARALRDAGHEVIYTGLRRTPEQIIETVRDEDAVLLGLSSLSGAHGHLFPRICETLREHNMGDVIVFGGGIIPEDDWPPLFEAGVRALFGLAQPLRKWLSSLQLLSSVTTLVLVTGRDGIGIHLHEGETLDDRMDAAKAGDRRALARLLSSIENGELHIQEPQRNDSDWKILALTGPPGVGKSCLLDRLLHEWVDHGLRIAVLAVDPSSPRSGGALLGDRVRMQVVDDVERKDSVYVRSVATRKTSGSVPLVVREMAFCLLDVGWDKVVIETVGAGQSEVRCAAVADRIVLVEGAARGDGVQAEKAGLLELADAVIVNKSDLDGAQRHADELRESLHLGHEEAPEVHLVSALHGTGISEVASTLLSVEQSARAGRARWRERLLSHHERQLLEHSKFELLLSKIEEGLMSFDEAYAELRNGNE